MALWVFAISFVGRRSESLWVPVRGIRRRIEGAVSEDHGEINEKWLVLVRINKVTNKIGTDLGPVLAVDEVFFFPVELQ